MVYGLSLVASLVALGNALTHLIAADVATLTLPVGLPGLGAHVRLDSLAAFFLVVANLGGAAASLYALGYGRHEAAPLRVLPFFPVYLAGMNLVVLADDAFTFLVAWEFMSLASWGLVMANDRSSDNSRAAYIYLVMAAFGTLALLLAFGLLAGPEGNYAFDAMRRAHQEAPTGRACAAAGPRRGGIEGRARAAARLAAARASGRAEPRLRPDERRDDQGRGLRLSCASPSTCSASRPGGSSLIVLAVAGVTTVLGVLYALMQHDLKRLLAYHTVENIGIIFIGLGLALAFRANDIDWAAALALTAALFHVLNHSIFKSLLFFGAGAVLTATGERDMEKLGGLIHRMPQTAVSS